MTKRSRLYFNNRNHIWKKETEDKSVSITRFKVAVVGSAKKNVEEYYIIIVLNLF